jgi:four helix bundle protein
MKQNIIKDKTYAFALKIIKMYQQIGKEKNEYVLSKQLLRSGTAVGASVSEAEHAQSKADFIHKLNIALKEANESLYWINLLKDSGYLSPASYNSLFEDCNEIVSILVAIIKTSKKSK